MPHYLYAFAVTRSQLSHFWFDHATYGVIGRFCMQISKPIQVQRVEFQEREGIIRPLVDRLARVLLSTYLREQLIGRDSLVRLHTPVPNCYTIP